MCANGTFNFIADASEVAAPAVVNIVAEMRTAFLSGMASGSGFIIDASGLVATNAHVVSHATSGSKLVVTLNDGRKYTGRVYALDAQLDVAVVKLDLPPGEPPLPVARIGQSGEARPGEWVVALGSPLRLQNTVTAGIISSMARSASEIGLGQQSYEYLQTDASINQGNSGGPLVNLAGEVIGINTAKLGGEHVSGISFAIPMDTAWPVIQQLIQYKSVRRPYLGIKFHSSSTSARHPSGRLLPEHEVTVLEVQPGSPAEVAGLRSGDVIVEFDKRRVKKNRDVVERLGYEYGRAIEVKVRRGGEIRALKIVSSKPPGDAR